MDSSGSNLQRFLNSVTPIVPSRTLPQVNLTFLAFQNFAPLTSRALISAVPFSVFSLSLLMLSRFESFRLFFLN